MLGVTEDRHLVDKYENPGIIQTSELITCVTHIHIPGNINSLTQCFRCIIRDLFLDVTVKLKSLSLLFEALTKIIFHVHVRRAHNKI